MTMPEIKKCSLYDIDETLASSHSIVPPKTRYSTDKQIGNLTVSELKNLIKECLRELEDEKQFTENNYKAMWKKQPMTTDGFKCGG